MSGLQVKGLRNVEVGVGFLNFRSHIEVHVLTNDFLDVILELFILFFELM